MWGCQTCGVEIGDGVTAHEGEDFDGTQEIVGHCFRCGRTMIVELPDLSQIPDEDFLAEVEAEQDAYEADAFNYGYDGDEDMGESPRFHFLDGEF